MKKVLLHIEGLQDKKDCESLERQLIKNKNIKSIKTYLDDSSALFIVDDNTSIDDIEKLINETEYTYQGIDLISKDKKSSLLYLLLIGIISLLLVYILIANEFNLPLLSIFTFNTYKKPYIIITFILSVIGIISIYNTLLNGINSLFEKNTNLNTLIFISILSSTLIGIISLFNNNISIVGFDLTIFTVLFVKIKEYFECSNKYKINTEIKQVSRTKVNKVNIKETDTYKEIAITSVKEGDKIICFSGDKVYLDGIVTKGISHVDESFITGKSLSEEKNINDKIYAGSINCEKEIEYEVKKTKSNSLLSVIKKEILCALHDKEKYQSKVDNYSKVIIVITILIGIIIFVISYLFTKDISLSLQKGLLIGVLFSPFSLILSTFYSSCRNMRWAYQKGLWIKTNNILEEVNNIDTIVFDKTGTLTNGYSSISKINNHSELTDKELLEILGSIEKHSTHSIARGITKYLKGEKIKANKDFITEDLTGYGVKAKDGNNLYYACNGELLKKLDIINSYEEEERKLKNAGNEVVYLTKNNKVIATFGLKDTLRKEAKNIIKDLIDKNKEIIILSGDNENVTTRIAKELGVEKVVSETNFKDKRKYIKELLKNKKVMVVGDGINDAPSLANSTIGISIKNNSAIPLAASDAIITSDSLYKVLELINLGKNVTKKLKLNIIISIITSLILSIISIGIIPIISINTLWIVCIMLFSLALVILNSLR